MSSAVRSQQEQAPEPPPAGGSRWLSLLVPLSFAAALLVPIASIVCTFPLVVNMPTWDQWALVPLWAAHHRGEPVLPLLLEPYNGHLNLLPRLFFFVLGLITHWNVRTEMTGLYLAAAATLVLLLWLLGRGDRRCLLLAFPVACLSYSLVQYENFMSGFALCEILTQLMVTVTCCLLTLPRLSKGAYGGAMLSAGAATLSWGAGLASWYSGIAVLALRRDEPRRRLATWAAVSVLVTVGVKLAAGGAFGSTRWGQVPTCFFVVLGRPWDPRQVSSIAASMRLGIVALAISGALGVWAWRRLGQASLPWLSLAFAAVGGSGLIAIGRSAAGAEQALASHYTTAATPLLIACVVWTFQLFLRLGDDGRIPLAASRGLAVAFAAIAALMPLYASARVVPMIRSWDPIVRGNALAIARGTATDEAIRASHYPDPATVREATEVLRRYHLAWFRAAVAAGSPAGTLDRLAGVQPGPTPLVLKGDEPLLLEGWAVGSQAEGGPARGIRVFVDGTSVPIVPTLDQPRDDVAAFFHDRRFRDSGWTATLPAGAIARGRHHLLVGIADWDQGIVVVADRDVEVASGR